ncbi:hypothetical protein ACJX0J_016813, partial [Zea mays]
EVVNSAFLYNKMSHFLIGIHVILPVGPVTLLTEGVKHNSIFMNIIISCAGFELETGIHKSVIPFLAIFLVIISFFITREQWLYSVVFIILYAILVYNADNSQVFFFNYKYLCLTKVSMWNIFYLFEVIYLFREAIQIKRVLNLIGLYWLYPAACLVRRLFSNILISLKNINLFSFVRRFHLQSIQSSLLLICLN